MVYDSFQPLVEAARKKSGRTPMAVAGAADRKVIEAAMEAVRQQIAVPILIGDPAGIKKILAEAYPGVSPRDYEILGASTEEACGRAAAALVREGSAGFIMKGMVDTRLVLKPVVDRETGLYTGRTMSHVALNQIRGFSRLIAITDGGMIPYPGLDEKKEILKNVFGLLRQLGYQKPAAAVLCAVEKENPRMSETVDAAALAALAGDGFFGEATVRGPISYDIAVSPEAAAAKGYDCPESGAFDVFLAPTMAAGNILNKSLIAFGGGKMAGVVTGAAVPVVVSSRGASPEEKFLSVVLASLLAGSENPAGKNSPAAGEK